MNKLLENKFPTYPKGYYAMFWRNVKITKQIVFYLNNGRQRRNAKKIEQKIITK